MDRMTARLRTAVRGEGGSILPLILGAVALALLAVLVCVDATSLYLAQKRLDGLADAAALAGADGFVLDVVAGSPTVRLEPASVREQALELIAVAAPDAVLLDAGVPDGSSARVTVGGTWHPPMFALFLPDGVELRATATSRTVLG